MDFATATSETFLRISADEVAQALKVPKSRIYFARLGSGGKTKPARPPANWRREISILFRSRAAQLIELAKQLESEQADLDRIEGRKEKST